MRPDHQERGTSAGGPTRWPISLPPGLLLPAASLPVVGSGPGDVRWAIETPGGPIPYKGVGFAAAAQEGPASSAGRWAGPREPPAAAERARVGRRRPTVPPVGGAMRPSRARRSVPISWAPRARRRDLANAICLALATVAAASAFNFEGGFEFGGAAHYSGTLAPLALVIVACRLIAAVIDRDGKTGSDS